MYYPLPYWFHTCIANHCSKKLGVRLVAAVDSNMFGHINKYQQLIKVFSIWHYLHIHLVMWPLFLFRTPSKCYVPLPCNKQVLSHFSLWSYSSHIPGIILKTHALALNPLIDKSLIAKMHPYLLSFICLLQQLFPSQYCALNMKERYTDSEDASFYKTKLSFTIVQLKSVTVYWNDGITLV